MQDGFRKPSEFRQRQVSGSTSIFIDDREERLAQEIRDHYLSKECIFMDADFKRMAIDASYQWNPINPEAETPNYKQFMALNGFLHLFEKRNYFSSRRSDFKSGSPPYAELENMFVDEITQIVNSEDRNLVLNCDQTSWKLYPNGILTWADTGSQNMAISITRNEQET
jgi:hypothetical protein